METYLNLWDYS